MRAKLDAAHWVRIIWALTALVLFGVGVGWIWWPASQRIAQVRSNAHEVYEEANAIDEATRRAAQLQAAQIRVEADLRALGGVRSEGEVTSALLRLFHDAAKRDGVDIREVAPENGRGSGANAREDAQANAGSVLLGTDLAIGLSGPFRNVIALISDLPRHDVLIDIRDVRFASDASVKTPPILNVTLHSTVYRVTALPTSEGAYVRALR